MSISTFLTIIIFEITFTCLFLFLWILHNFDKISDKQRDLELQVKNLEREFEIFKKELQLIMSKLQKTFAPQRKFFCFLLASFKKSRTFAALKSVLDLYPANTYIIIYIREGVRMPVMAYIIAYSTDFNNTHSRIFFIYTKMKTENANPATPTTQYCFPAEAVNDYFINPACVEDFAKTMRLYNQIVAEYFLEDGNIPYGIARGVNSLNAFIEVLSPYFTISKNN